MIKEILNDIQTSDVKDISFDMRNSRIDVLLMDATRISFEDVVSFYYTDEEKSYTDHQSLRPIVFDRAGFDTIFSDDDEDETVSVPNVSLCVKDRSVLIEAKSIRIGNNSYKLTARSN